MPENGAVDSTRAVFFLVTLSSTNDRAPYFVAAAALLCLALLTQAPGKTKAEHSDPLLPRPELLKVAARAYLNVVADYYWIQTVQALGRARTRDEYRDIYWYAELATTLDPDFDIIYRFAGTSIPHNLGRETWVNTRESTALLEKGVARFPKDVRLQVLLAFNYSYFHHDYARAGTLLANTARMQGAPKYLGALATRQLAQAGRIDSGLELARSLYEQETDPDAKALFERRIGQLLTERVLQQVDAAIASYKDKRGELPTTIQELTQEGLLPPVTDPSGGTLFIDDKGRAQSTSESGRLEVNTGPKEAP
jgi:hypothetical protein